MACLAQARGHRIGDRSQSACVEIHLARRKALGVLPVINRKAVEYTVMTALAPGAISIDEVGVKVNTTSTVGIFGPARMPITFAAGH